MFKKITILIIIFLLFFSFLLIAHKTKATQTIQTKYPEIMGEKIDENTTFPGYIRYIYVFMMGLVGIVATGVLVFGGILYMTSGTITSTDEAKKYIFGAISGLILAFASYLILYTINPSLVSLTTLNVNEVDDNEIVNEINKPHQTKPLCQDGKGACYSSCPQDWTESGSCKSGEKCCLPPSSGSF